MKLRNKKTGEIKDIHEITSDTYIMNNGVWSYNAVSSLAELNEDWEDVEPEEEPKMYYYITSCGEIAHRGYRLWENESVYDKKRQEIGNHFETEEEAEKAVEKLKALKRLKDNGFKFEGIKEDYTRICQVPVRTGKRYLQFKKSEDEEWMKENWNDLDICFGGKE